MNHTKRRATRHAIKSTGRPTGAGTGTRAGASGSAEDPAALLAEVLAISGSDLDPDEIDVVICVIQATGDNPRWTWFLQLADDLGMGLVSAIRSAAPEDDGWSAPQVTRESTLLGLVRAADPEHGAGFLRFLAQVTIESHFNQTPDGRPILNVTPPGPIPTDLRLGLVMLAANVLLIRDRDPEPTLAADPVSAPAHASLWVNCAGHFAPALAEDVARGAADAEPIGMHQLPDLYLLWCLDSAWGPVAWCAAARRQLPPPGSAARFGLVLSGYDLEALVRGEIPREIEIGRAVSSSVDDSSGGEIGSELGGEGETLS